MKNDQSNLQVSSYFKNGELYVEIEDEDLNIDDLTTEELSLAMKEGVRSAVLELVKNIRH